MKSKRTLILLAGLVVLAAAFLLIDFHLAASNTGLNHSAVTISMGEDMPVTMQQRQPITVLVQGKGGLGGAMQAALLKELRGSGLGDYVLVEELAESYTSPVLRVQVQQPSELWTPFYAKCDVTVQADFMSHGLISSLGSQPVVSNNLNGPMINQSGTYTLKDWSAGLISKPGYERMVAESLAKKIVEELMKQYGLIL